MNAKVFKLSFFLSISLTLIAPNTRLNAENQAYKIGILTSLTGMADKWCKYQNLGIELAQEELKSEGKNFKLIFEDSATNSVKAISAYKKLVKLDRVDAIINNEFGHIILPIIPMTKKDKILMLSISNPNPNTCNAAAGFFYSLTSQFTLSESAFDKFFEINPQVKKIALYIFDDPEWGNVYEGIWRKIAKKRNIEIVDLYKSLEFTPDLKTPITKSLRAKPDAILVAHNPDSFIKAKSQLQFKGEIVFANNILEFLASNPKQISDLNRIYFADPLISDEFRSKFKNRFNLEPILEAFAGYEAMRSIAKAFEINPKEPYKSINQVTYLGVAGEIDFRPNDCKANHSNFGLFQFVNSEIKAIN